jgi:hypothetical protein
VLRYATSVYGQDVLLGASWGLIWWFVGAGAAIILAHALAMAIVGGRSRRQGR